MGRHFLKTSKKDFPFTKVVFASQMLADKHVHLTKNAMNLKCLARLVCYVRGH